MPFPVKHLIQSQSKLICVKKDDLVSASFNLMIEHDYSQLPVINDDNMPLGMITHESILRGIRNFNSQLNKLHVRDVMITAPIFNLEDDLFDLLDRLKNTNAVLIVKPDKDLTGIVTSYDTTEYFRKRTENLMLVEDIETAIKDLILASYSSTEGELDETRLSEAITRICSNEDKTSPKIKPFAALTLNEYISLLLFKDTWKVVGPIFDIPIQQLKGLLEEIRKIRNDLAHFRNEIDIEQQERLRFCSNWITKRQEDWERIRYISADKEINEGQNKNESQSVEEEINNLNPANEIAMLQQNGPNDSRYSPLVDYLVGQPGKNDQIKLTFDEIEAIIGGDLPHSARHHRAWWANDAIGHSYAQSWLEAGWRTGYINMTEGHVTFSRIREREKAYIGFFSKILADLKKTDFPSKNVSPDGTSWMVVYNVPSKDASNAIFVFSFSRDKRFRVELYLDLYDYDKTKAIFDTLMKNKEKYEENLGSLSWERIDQKRASRVAIYHPGQITDDRKKLDALRIWAVDTMVKFHQTLAQDVESMLSNIS